MDSTTNDDKKINNIDQESMPTSGNSSSTKLHSFIPIPIPTSERSLLDQNIRHENRFLDFLKANPSKEWFLKFGIVGRISPFTYLRRLASHRTTAAAGLPDISAGGRWRHFRVPFVRKINWPALIKYCKNWAKQPTSIALIVWLLFVAAGLLVLLLLMTGLLNSAIPKSSVRKRWTEITNQILNALFTILCIYQYPKLFHHLILLYRWKTSDAAELRKTYCKDVASGRPFERAHLSFVVALLHITCFAQFALCALYWGYSSKNRPDWAEILFIVLGIAAPVIAFFYIVYSPLGRKYSDPDLQLDEESQRIANHNTDINMKPQLSRRVLVTRPEWVGGLFDIRDDTTVACTSFFCTFCVFGWNMERFGFGNMYVHIVTFVLLCIAPFWVFNVAGLNISDETVRYVVGAVGIILCFFGLLYGGFWRSQMRKRFKLPGNTLCCGYPLITDFIQWMFCWSCSLAQEVRTGNYYEIEEESFYRIETAQPDVLVPLPREDGVKPDLEGSLTNNSDEDQAIEIEKMMRPPIPPLIQIEDGKNMTE